MRLNHFKILKVLICGALLFFASLSSTMGFAADDDEFLPNVTGVIFNSESSLNSMKKAKLYRAFTPVRRDMTKFTPRPGDQRRIGSCVGWAVAYAARTQQYIWDNDTKISDANIASPSALYNSMYEVERDNCDDGSRINVALDFMMNVGVPSVADFSYNKNSRCYQMIEAKHLQGAKKFRIKGWKLVYSRRRGDKNDLISSVRSQLAQFKPVIVAMYVPDGFTRFKGRGVFDGTIIENKDEGHAVTVIAYDDEMRAFKIINSWGVSWGQEGYAWVSYEAFSQLIFAAYVMETAATKREAPPTPPKPPKPPVNDDVRNEKALVQAAVAGLNCAGVSRFSAKQKTIRAFVGSQKDKDKLQNIFAKQLPLYKVEIENAPWPKCEALQTFSHPLSQPQGLKIAVNEFSALEDVTLKEGDQLAITITTPDFPSYLYATYLQKDVDGKHEAVHLIQSVDPLKQYPPNTVITIGDGKDGGDEFEVVGPNFGKELIVVLASASPLYDNERPWVEVERDYLSSIREVMLKKIAGKQTRRIGAQILSVTTRAK